MGFETSYVTASRLGSPYSVPILIDRDTMYSNIPRPTDGKLDSVSISSGQLLVSDFDTVNESPWKYYTKSGSIDKNIPKNIIPSGIIIFDGNSSNTAFHFIGGIYADRSFAPLTSFWYDSNMELTSIGNASYVSFRGAINFSVTSGYGETMEQIATAESFAIVVFKYDSDASSGRYAIELYSKNGGMWKRVSGFGAVNAAPIETFDLALTDEAAHKIPPYDPGGNSGPAGGGGHFGTDRPSDSIDIPNGSAANSLADAGIFSHYLMSVSDLKQFGDWLWADNIIETLNKELITLWYGNIFEAIISLFSYPFAPALLNGVKTSPDVVYLGSYNTATPSAGRLTNDFAQIDWGSVNITEYWGNFLDYAPHTKIQLYLPWGTGFVDIDPNEVMNSSIQVVTNIELSKGTCVHNVVNGAGCVLGTYNAFCGAQYPITSKDTSGKAIGAAVAGVSLAISHATGAVAKDSANIAQTASAHARKQESLGLDSSGMRSVAERASKEAANYNAISNRAAKISGSSAIAAARTPASFNRNGAFSPNAAMLGVQYPYFIMTWPDQSVPSQYGNHVGYPSNMYQSLDRLRGYTEVGAIHLEGINCTEHEREELLSMLQGGVIL